MSQNKKPKEYRKNKQAFDSVINHLRRTGRPWLAPCHAVNPERVGTGGSRNPAKPNLVEFWADVFQAVKKALPRDISRVDFHIAYTLFDSEDAIECEQQAQKILGNRRHSVEQRLGAEFINRGIYPVQGRGYFYSPRREVR